MDNKQNLLLKEIDSLKKLNDRYSLAISSAGIGIWDLDLIENKLIWDDQMYEIYKVKKKNFAGGYETWKKGIHPDDLKRTDQEVKQAVKKGKIFNSEFRVVWPNGEVRFMKAFARIIRDNNGKPQRMIGVNWDITQQKKMEQDILKLATIDSLTGIFNRRQFLKKAKEELQRANRYNLPMSIFILDVDRFKYINDNYGHDAGDEVLKVLAIECQNKLRKSDTFCRLGGEEFAAILPHTSLEDAHGSTKRMIDHLERLRVGTVSGPVWFTVSIGVTEKKEKEQNLDAILKRADNALYKAKKAGRNQVQVI